MILVVSTSNGIPIGTYLAQVVGVEPKPAVNDFKPSLLWTFEILSGTQEKQKVSGFTSQVPKPTTNCGKFLSGSLGRPLQDNERIELSDLIGRRVMIVVDKAKSGASKVTSVSPSLPV